MTHPGSPSQPPAAEPPSRRLGDLLARLGGADAAILQMARDTGRSRFVQMGLVLLSTAGIAVLSMSFALAIGLDLYWLVAVLAGLVWGFIILNLDRMLILNLDLRGGFWRIVMIVVPRILIAALLGAVIATPLVLQVFQVEIQKQIAETQTKDEATLNTSLKDTATKVELDNVRADIDKNEKIAKGEIPPVDTPDVQAQEKYLKEAEDKLVKLRATSDQARRAWQCELYGSSCEDSTNVRGNGNLAKAREQEYLTALAQTNAAERDVTTIKAALDNARRNAGTLSGKALADAQAEANRLLPGLRDREADLEKAFNSRLDTRGDKIAENDGLLAQIVALNDLSAGKPEAWMTHLLVGGLFFMIELLPVLVKIMTSLGPPSLYERIREQVENRRFDDATSEMRLSAQERDDAEHRIAAVHRKNQEIEDDMVVRERDLGLKANARVAQEMQGVLDVALADWAQQVQTTLHRAAAQNGSAQNGGASSWNGATGNGTSGNGASASSTAPTVVVQTQPRVANGIPGQATTTVRSKFSVPDGSKL